MKTLPPLDLKDDVKNFKAFSDKREVEFLNCKHEDIKHKEGRLECKCGVGYSGPRLDELYKLLTEK